MSFDDTVSPLQREPEKSSSTCLVLGFVLGGIGAVVLLCGGCCVGLVFFGMDQISTQVKADLAGNEVLQEHIGELQTFEMEKWESIQHAGEDDYIFRVAGPRGAGRVEVECLDNDEGVYEVWSGSLILDDGTEFDLFPDGDRWQVEGLTLEANAMGEASDEIGDAEFTRSVRADIEEHPVLVEHIGTISDFTYDYTRSMEEPGGDVFVFQSKGDKGTGELRVRWVTEKNTAERVAAGELIMESGEKFQLFPENPLE